MTYGITHVRMLFVCLAWALAAPAANGAEFEYNGVFTLCTGTCDSFAALNGDPANSSIARGTIEIDVGPNATFSDAEIGTFAVEILNPDPTTPLAPYNGNNPTTSNPLTLTNAVANIYGSGTTDANGELASGTIQFEFTVPPFSSNGAWVNFDVATGGGEGCVFFATAGCLPGATQFTLLDGSFARLSDTLVAGVISVDDDTGDTVWVNRAPSGLIQATVRDIASQATVANCSYFTTTDATPVAVADLTVGSSVAIAVLAVNYAAGGKIWVQVSDITDNCAALLGKPFLSTSWRALGMATSSGQSTATSYVSVLGQNKDNGQIRVQTKGLNGTFNRNVSFFNSAYSAIDMTTFTLGSTPVGAVVAISPGNQVQLQVRNLLNGIVRGSTKAFPGGFTPVGATSINNGSRLVAILARRVQGGRSEVRLFNEASGAAEGTFTVLHPNVLPKDIKTVKIDGVDHVVVMGQRAATGRSRVEVYTTAGTQISRSQYLPGDYTLPGVDYAAGLALITTDSADGNGSGEVGVLGLDASLTDRAHLKDASSGDFVRHIFAP